MKTPTLLSLIIRGFLIICLIDLVLIGTVAGISWWTAWTDLDQFKSAIQVAGLVVIGLGLLGIKGRQDPSRSFENQSSLSASQMDNWDRTQQTLSDLAERYWFPLVMFFAGGVGLLIGWLL